MTKHINSWFYVRKEEFFLSTTEEVKMYLRNVDKSKRKIALAIKIVEWSGKRKIKETIEEKKNEW